MLGLFYAKNPSALEKHADAPYHLLGRHALSGARTAVDAGAGACVWGRMRGREGLRREIERAGAKLPAEASDAQLVLAAYRLWGEETPEKIFGPVSYAVIDRDRSELMLVRDRMGEENVFYAPKGGGVSFANRIAPLLDAPGVSRTVDRDGVAEIFALGPAHTPGRTPFCDILELEPGCALFAGENSVRVRRYFALEALPHEDDIAHTIEKTRFLLEQAVSETIAFQPSCMISGGLDSTAVMALYAKITGAPPLGFSVDYAGDERDFAATSFRPERDSPWAKRACEAIGARQLCIEIGSEELYDALFDAAGLRERPGMGDIDSSMLLFARSISTCSGAALMGECADEAFGGYPWFQREELLWRDGFAWSGSLSLRESVLQKNVRERVQIGKYAHARYHEAISRLPVLPGEEGAQARLRQMQGLVFKFFMPNLQERAACMCGAAGVVPLTPFCDERLIEYAYNVPWEIKNLHGEAKGLLRAAVEDLIPESLLRRKKSPYPKTCSPVYADLLRAGIRRLSREKDAPLWQICDREEILRLAGSALSPADTPWYGQLMAGPQMLAYLLQVNEWLKNTGAEIEI